MKKWLCPFLILLFFFIPAPVSAADTDEMVRQQLDESGYYSLFSLLPEEAEAYFDGSFEADDLDKLTLPGLLQKGIDLLRDKAGKPLSLLGTMMAVTLLSALLSGFHGDGGNGVAFRPVISLTMTALLAGTIVQAVQDTAALIEKLSSFMLAFLPVFAASAATSGKPASAFVWYGTTLSAIEIFSTAVHHLVLPLLMIFIALSFVSVLAPDLHAAALIKSVKSLALWILSFCLTIFLALLTIKTSVSGAADGVTLKTAKFLLSSAIPVVGSAIGDAWAAVSGCLGLVKSTIGVFGILVIGILFLPQILYLGALTGLLSLGASAAETLSEKEPAEVMRVSAAAASIMLALLVCYALMLLAAIAMVLLVHT